MSAGLSLSFIRLVVELEELEPCTPNAVISMICIVVNDLG